MSVEAHVRKNKRCVSISRDGDDYVAKDQELGIMMRAQDLNRLRKACLWLQWDIEETKLASLPAGTRYGQVSS